MRKGKFGAILVTVLVLILVLAIVLFSIMGFLTEQQWDGKGYKNVLLGAKYDVTFYKPHAKKAMILIPGLMASTLYDMDEDDYAVWGISGFANLFGEFVTAMGSKEPNAVEDAFSYLISTLSCDENNLPYVRRRVGNMLDEDKYGSFDGMKYMYDILAPLYGKQYDIVVWQYDWRQTNMGSAEQLQHFIQYNGWDEVMFFTHSMGGVVVSNYLAMSEKNREMTKLFVPFGCPFFGSMDAITNLFYSESGGGMIDTILSMLEKAVNQTFSLQDIARTLASVYELLPMPAFDNTPYFGPTAGVYYYGVSDRDFVVKPKPNPNTSSYGEKIALYSGKTTALTYDGKRTTSGEFYNILKEFTFTKRADGTSIPAMYTLPDYRERLFIDGVFVAHLVPTEFILGLGVSTIIGADINSAGKVVGEVRSMLGDGTVPAFSASAGLPLNAPNVHLVYGIGHGPLADNNGLDHELKEWTGLRYLEGIMKKYIAKTDAELSL